MHTPKSIAFVTLIYTIATIFIFIYNMFKTGGEVSFVIPIKQTLKCTHMPCSFKASILNIISEPNIVLSKQLWTCLYIVSRFLLCFSRSTQSEFKVYQIRRDFALRANKNTNVMRFQIVSTTMYFLTRYRSFKTALNVTKYSTRFSALCLKVNSTEFKVHPSKKGFDWRANIHTLRQLIYMRI